MAFVRVDLIADRAVLEEAEADIASAPARFNALANHIVLGRGGVKERLARELTPYPGKPRYPLRWKSARQRRAFFASRGFGRGIPAQRTGALQRAWTIRYKPLTQGGDGEVQITNEAPYAGFVIGSDQQPFHLDTGWVRLDTSPALPPISAEMLDDLSQAWLSVLDRSSR